MNGAKVLVVGGGGREHALIHTLLQSEQVDEAFCAPGNAGIALEAKTVNLKADQMDELARWACMNEIDLTVVGPEDPLANGISKAFYDHNGMHVFGPSEAAAQIEASKVFAKAFMSKYGIKTPAYQRFDDIELAAYYACEDLPQVMKADGLCAGKGAFVCRTKEDVNDAKQQLLGLGTAARKIIVEKCISDGEEASILALTDGRTIKTLASSQDHKSLLDGDKGPNTGGMGAYAPAPVITEELSKEIEAKVLRPAVNGMEGEGRFYSGCLYAGMMMTDEGPQVLEFNCRFGDPETQAVLMMLDTKQTDFYEVLTACVHGRLNDVEIVNRPGAAACVVMASGGYPGKYEKGKPITFGEGLIDVPEFKIYHSGTAMKGGQFVTNGGRVLGVTAYGKDHSAAIGRAYAAVGHINWEGEQHRTDIGWRALKRLEV
jgi:phosphoribosylamine--glycine ligase